MRVSSATQLPSENRVLIPFFLIVSSKNNIGLLISSSTLLLIAISMAPLPTAPAAILVHRQQSLMSASLYPQLLTLARKLFTGFVANVR
jgi:hypothetical protein